MNDESSQLTPAQASPERKPVLMLRVGRSNGGGKPSATSIAVMARANTTQALVGSNGQTALVRFRSAAIRPQAATNDRPHTGVSP